MNLLKISKSFKSSFKRKNNQKNQLNKKSRKIHLIILQANHSMRINIKYGIKMRKNSLKIKNYMINYNHHIIKE